MIDDYKIKIKVEGIRVLVIDNSKDSISKEEEIKAMLKVLDRMRALIEKQ